MGGYDDWLEAPYLDQVEREEERMHILNIASQDSENTDLMREAVIHALEKPGLSSWVRVFYMDLSAAHEVDASNEVLIKQQIDKEREV